MTRKPISPIKQLFKLNSRSLVLLRKSLQSMFRLSWTDCFLSVRWYFMKELSACWSFSIDSSAYCFIWLPPFPIWASCARALSRLILNVFEASSSASSTTCCESFPSSSLTLSMSIPKLSENTFPDISNFLRGTFNEKYLSSSERQETYFTSQSRMLRIWILEVWFTARILNMWYIPIVWNLLWLISSSIMFGHWFIRSPITVALCIPTRSLFPIFNIYKFWFPFRPTARYSRPVWPNRHPNIDRLVNTQFGDRRYGLILLLISEGGTFWFLNCPA